MKKLIPILLIAVLYCSCNDSQNNQNADELQNILAEVDSLKKLVQEKVATEKGQITTFLTFQEYNAEEAMNFYVDVFENSKILDIRRYGKDSPAKEGAILMARFELNGSQFACSDSYIKHAWDFSPAVSNWVDCTSEEEIKRLLATLSEEGKIMMPLDNYGFSTLFVYVEDKFGVYWQLNLD